MTALKTERVGRGYGITNVSVCDYATVGEGKVAHVVDDGHPLCGRKGAVRFVALNADARAIVVMRLPVCQSCRERLGSVPPPELVKEVAA